MSSPNPIQPPVLVPPELPIRPARRGKRRLMVAVLILLSLPLLASGTYLLSRASVSSGIEAKIRARGEPFTLAELAAAQPTVPEDQNAATALLELWRAEDPAFWDAIESGASPLPDRVSPDTDPRLPLLGKQWVELPESGPLPEPMWELIASHVAKRAEHRAAVRKAMQRPHFVFPIPYTNGAAALLPHLDWAGREQHEFHLEFFDALERRDTEAAQAALESMARVGHLLAGEPLLVSQLLRTRIYRETLEGFARLLSASPLDPADLARSEQLVASLDPIRALRPALVMERAIGLSFIELPVKEFIRIGGDEPHEMALRSRGIFRMMRVCGVPVIGRARLLDVYERVLAMVDADPVAGAVQLMPFAEAEKSGEWYSLQHPVTTSSLAAFKSGPRFASLEALRRSALIVIAVERFRAANAGQLPSGLAELPVPADPRLLADPYGDTLKYRRLAEGYVVYSVGPDGTDDNGRPGRSGRGSMATDDTITIRR